MAVNKIIVPIKINTQAEYLLIYAAQLALASNYKLSCICSIQDSIESKNNNTHDLKMGYLNIINQALQENNVPYEVILTKQDLERNLKGIMNSNLPYIIVMDLTDLDANFLSISTTKMPVLLLSEA